MTFLNYVLNTRSARSRVSGIIDSLICIVLFVIGFKKFDQHDYPMAAWYLFLFLIFDLQALYWFIIAKLEDKEHS